MTIRELDDIAAQIDDGCPFYLPRLVAEFRVALTTLRACGQGECSDPEFCEERAPRSLCARCRARILLASWSAGGGE